MVTDGRSFRPFSWRAVVTGTVASRLVAMTVGLVLATALGPTTIAAAAGPANTSLPAISGTAATGQVLTTSTGTWSGTPTTYAYQWRSCDSAGNNCVVETNNANGQTYTPVDYDVGKTLRVKVTATTSGGSTAATSAQTAAVQNVKYKPVNLSAPTV